MGGITVLFTLESSMSFQETSIFAGRSNRKAPRYPNPHAAPPLVTLDARILMHTVSGDPLANQMPKITLQRMEAAQGQMNTISRVFLTAFRVESQALRVGWQEGRMSTVFEPATDPVMAMIATQATPMRKRTPTVRGLRETAWSALGPRGAPSARMGRRARVKAATAIAQVGGVGGGLLRVCVLAKHSNV